MTPLDGHARLILDSPGARVLLVSSGIHAHDSRLQPVPTAELSVKDLAQCLVDQAKLDPDHLTTLINVGSPEEFSAALEEASCQAEDVLFFWYVGHGLVSPARELHLATGATIDLNQGVPGYQALPYSVIRNILGRCPAKLIVIGLDCCCSGRAEGWTISNGDDPFDVTVQHGLYVLTSAGRNELAWAPPGRHTAFTGMMIRLLTRGDPEAPRLLALDDVYRSLDRSLSEEGSSRPHRYAADHGDTALLAPNLAYRSGPLRGGFSPYRGLAAYRPEDAPFFFGREDLSRVVVDRLAERPAAQSPLVVTGPSGSAFIAALCSAARIENAGVPLALVVLGVRADFFGHCAAYLALSPALERPVIVSPMSEGQLRMAITKPAELAGLQIEDGLVELLLQDLERTGRSADGPGAALPLLSHALMVTWQNRSESVLTLAGYRAGGGIAGALAQTADYTLGQLDLDGREIARRLLLGLVHLGDGTDDTRRYVSLSELLPAPDAPGHAAARHVLNLFIHARLLTVDTDKAGIIHEALIRAWPQFRTWIDDSRAALLASERIGQDATAWERSGRDRNFLYAGRRLENALAATDQPGFTLTPLQQEFLASSTRRARSRARSARQLMTFDRSGQLMAAGSSAGEIGLWNVSDIAHAVPAAAWSATNADLGTDILAVEFSPDGRLLASAGADGTVRLWDITDLGHPRQVGPRLARLSSAEYQVAFSSDGRILAASGADGKVRLWKVTDPARPQLVSTLSGPIGIVYNVSFSPDGRYLATANGDKTVALWDIANPAEPGSIGVLTGFSGTVFSAAFSRSGNAIAAGSQDNTVRLWLTNPVSAASYICSVTGDPITRTEWAHYVPGTPYDPPCRASG